MRQMSTNTSPTLRSPSSSLDQKLREYNVQLEDSNKVSWGPRSVEHPRNWSGSQKWEVTVIVYWLEFFMTAISSAGTAAADSARQEYGISDTLAYFAFVTVYLLGQTVGGIFCSPISEVFGRRTIYLVGTSLFAIASVIVAIPPSMVAVYIGRFLQGVAASIPATVAFGNFDDMFMAHTRIWVVYGYTLAGMSGLVLGPIYSVFVTSTIGWRWVFYIAAIVAGASLIPCVTMMESNADNVLRKKIEDLRNETGQDLLPADLGDESKFSVNDFFQKSLLRPLWMLVSEPLVFFCAALCGIAFGLIYGLTEGLTIVYTQPPFGFSDTTASLAFIPILIGEILDVLPRFYDAYHIRRRRRLGRRILPETKITSFAIACPSLAIGLWIFAWTIPPKVTAVPWPVSMIGLVCIGFSANDFSYLLFGYVTDSYGQYAASAAGAVSLARGMMAAVFPLFTTQMFQGLGSNIATTILAVAATVFCFTPWLFLQYGGRLRKHSKMAANDEDCLVEENKQLGKEEQGHNESKSSGEKQGT